MKRAPVSVTPRVDTLIEDYADGSVLTTAPTRWLVTLARELESDNAVLTQHAFSIRAANRALREANAGLAKEVASLRRAQGWVRNTRHSRAP